MPAQFLLTLRQFNRDIRLYLFASGLVGFCLFSGIFSLLFNLYLLRLGYGPKSIGQVNAIGALAFALSSLPGSLLGGRWGNRRIMIIGLGIAIIGHALVSQAEFIAPALRKHFIIITHSLGLLGIALYIVNGYPFLMAVSSAKERNHVFSILAALFPLTGFAGSLLGGFLPGQFAGLLHLSLDHPRPYSHTLLLASVLLSPAVIALIATRKKSDQSEKELQTETAPLPFRLIALLSFIALLYTASEGAIRTFLNVYLDDALKVSTALIGTLAAIGQFLAVPAALSMPYLVGRYGSIRTFNGSMVCAALIMVPLALIPHWGIAALAFMSTMALAAVRRPAFTVFQQEMMPRRWRTAMAGAAATMTGFGYAGISLGGGYIIESAGYGTLFLLAGSISAIGTLLCWFCFRQHSDSIAE